MYKIAVVDDDKVEREHLKTNILKFAETNNTELSVDEYCNGDSLLKSEFKEYDIIFLDIAMDGKDGLQTAKELRNSSFNSLIIFCTNLEQYAINGYEVDATGYLIKPVTEFSLTQNLKKAINALKKDINPKIIIKTVHGNKVFNLNDILYVEVQKHNLYYHVLVNKNVEVIRCRGSMQSIVKNLNSEFFAQCSACYLVNMNHVKSLEKNIVYLGSDELPLSRNYKRSFTEKFMDYMLNNGVIRN